MRNKSDDLSCVTWSPVFPYFPEPGLREGQILTLYLQCLPKLRYPHDYELPQLLLSCVSHIRLCNLSLLLLIYFHLWELEYCFFQTRRYPPLPARHSQWKWGRFWNHLVSTITHGAADRKMKMLSYCLKNLAVESALSILLGSKSLPLTFSFAPHQLEFSGTQGLLISARYNRGQSTGS